MKKGQLLSQPFFYIFTIIVIGLILFIGFKYVGKIMTTGCQVQGMTFVGDVQSKINEVYSLSYGSSYECTIVGVSGQEDSRCQLVLPDNVKGLCFIDTTKGYNPEQIIFPEIKELVTKLGLNINKNLFFSTTQGASCTAEPVLLKKVTTQGVICLDLVKTKKFIIENKGTVVEIKKS